MNLDNLLRGERVCLTVLTPDNLTALVRWRENAGFLRW